jgi:excisionase family DNA binding protein
VTEETLLTKKEVAARLHISEYAVKQLILKGALPVVPVGARLRIRSADVSAYVNHPVFLAKGRVRTTDEITKAIDVRGFATRQDFTDALRCEPEQMWKARKQAFQQEKKKRKKARKQKKKNNPVPGVTGPLVKSQQPEKPREVQEMFLDSTNPYIRENYARLMDRRGRSC